MIPKKIIVKAKGEKTSGVSVILKFKMLQKNDFDFIVFLDDSGKAEISRDDLLRSFDRDRNLFLMDFCDPRQVFTGQIEAWVATTDEIEGAIKSYELYKKHISYPPDCLEKLNKAANLVSSIISVEIEQIK